MWVCSLLQAQSSADFEQAYASEVQSAFAWLADNALLINQELGQHQAPLILALAFPEVIRYNELSNLIETGALELAYTRGGSTVADFSIGPLQIKPSFVEALEQYHRCQCLNPGLRAYLYLPEAQSRRARQIRLQRLQSTEGQLRYLHIFYIVASCRWPDTLSRLSPSQRFIHLANAYNGGLHLNAEALAKLSERATFPYGSRYKGTQYRYAEIGLYFYPRIRAALCLF